MHLASASNETTSEKAPNKIYKKDIEKTVQYTRWIFLFLGVWPMIEKKSSTMEKYISKCLIVICFTGMTYLLIPTLCDTIMRVKIPLVRVLRLGPIGVCLSSILKLGFILIRCKTIKLCIEHMEHDWMLVERENERAIMMKNVRVGRGVTVIAFAFLFTGGIFYHTIIPILQGTRINAFNETVRPLVYPGYDIFVDAQKSPIYEFIFCTTCAAAIVRYTVTIAACNLAAVFVSHACGQLQIVMSRLGRIFDGIDEKQNSEILQKRITNVVHCHVRALRFSSRIDDVLREICLIEVVTATIIICLLEYYCMTEWNSSQPLAIIMYFVFLISYIFNIFIFCYIGDLLKEQCYEVGKSTYLIDWYKLPGKTGLSIVMILAMANYPRKISAGRMIDLSIASFGMIMKTSVMYLNILRAMAMD